MCWNAQCSPKSRCLFSWMSFPGSPRLSIFLRQKFFVFRDLSPHPEVAARHFRPGDACRGRYRRSDKSPGIPEIGRTLARLPGEFDRGEELVPEIKPFI